MKGGRSEQVKAVRSGLRWMAFLPPGAMVLLPPELQSRAMPPSVALLQLWPMLMSLALVISEG